jgi:hypothetical protein
MPVIDFSNVKTARYEPLPEGTYLFEIVNTEFADSKGGHEMLEVKLVPQDDELDGRYVVERFTFPHDDELEEGKTMGLPFLKALLEVLGFDVSASINMNQAAAQMIGMYVVGRVIVEDGAEGGKFNRVRNYSPANPA